MSERLSTKRLVLVILAFLTLGIVLATHAPAATAVSVDGVLKLMPVPVSVTAREGRFRVDENLVIGGTKLISPTDRAFRAAARFMSRLAGRAFS